MDITPSLMALNQSMKPTGGMTESFSWGSGFVRQKPMLDEHRIFGCSGQDKFRLALKQRLSPPRRCSTTFGSAARPWHR
jgi:hypothetical protein